MKRPTAVIVTTLLALVAMWVTLLLPPSHPSRAVANPTAAGLSGMANQPGIVPAPSASTGARPSGRAVTHRPRPQQSSAVRHSRSATVSSSASSAPSQKASAPVHPPGKPNSTKTHQPSAPPYSFAPVATGSGPAPTAELRLSDLRLHTGQLVTGNVKMTSAGALVFDAHTATSSSGTGSYPLSALHACVEYVGENACTPRSIPMPAYWPVSAADIARHQSYRIRILATVDSSLLAGIHVGWRGPKDVTVAGLTLPGGCQASVSPGYTAGCGLKYKVVTTAAGPLTVTTPTAGLEVSLKNTTNNTKVYSGPLDSPQQMQVPSAGEWSGHLYPANGSPVATVTVTFTWE